MPRRKQKPASSALDALITNSIGGRQHLLTILHKVEEIIEANGRNHLDKTLRESQPSFVFSPLWRVAVGWLLRKSTDKPLFNHPSQEYATMSVIALAIGKAIERKLPLAQLPQAIAELCTSIAAQVGHTFEMPILPTSSPKVDLHRYVGTISVAPPPDAPPSPFQLLVPSAYVLDVEDDDDEDEYSFENFSDTDDELIDPRQKLIIQINTIVALNDLEDCLFDGWTYAPMPTLLCIWDLVKELHQRERIGSSSANGYKASPAMTSTIFLNRANFPAHSVTSSIESIKRLNELKRRSPSFYNRKVNFAAIKPLQRTSYNETTFQLEHLVNLLNESKYHFRFDLTDPNADAPLSNAPAPSNMLELYKWVLSEHAKACKGCWEPHSFATRIVRALSPMQRFLATNTFGDIVNINGYLMCEAIVSSIEQSLETQSLLDAKIAAIEDSFDTVSDSNLGEWATSVAYLVRDAHADGVFDLLQAALTTYWNDYDLWDDFVAHSFGTQTAILVNNGVVAGLDVTEDNVLGILNSFVAWAKKKEPVRDLHQFNLSQQPTLPKNHSTQVPQRQEQPKQSGPTQLQKADAEAWYTAHSFLGRKRHPFDGKWSYCNRCDAEHFWNIHT